MTATVDRPARSSVPADALAGLGDTTRTADPGERWLSAARRSPWLRQWEAAWGGFIAVRRRPVGSRWSCQRARASTEGRLWRARVRILVCPLLVISIGVGMPSSAAWVSAECRRSCSVQPPGGLGEQFGGPPVGQPAVAGVGVQVGGPERYPGDAVGEEHRATAPPGEVAGQQPGGASLPGDLVDRSALAAYHRAPVGPVQVGDVQQQYLLGAGGGFVQQRPQRAFSKRDFRSRQEVGDRGPGAGPRPVRRRLRPGQPGGRVAGDPVLDPPSGAGGAQAGEVAVPRRRAGRGPPVGEPVTQLGGHGRAVKAGAAARRWAAASAAAGSAPRRRCAG